VKPLGGATEFGRELSKYTAAINTSPGMTPDGRLMVSVRPPVSVLDAARNSMPRLLLLATVTLALLVLFAALGSRLLVLIVAVFASTLPGAAVALTFSTRVNVADAPAARLAAVQLTVPLPPTRGVVQVQPDGRASDWNVELNGTRASSVALTAPGPLLVTAIVKDAF
jgi:hypothetical protein